MNNHLKFNFPTTHKVVTTIRDNTKPYSLQFQRTLLKPMGRQLRSGNECSFIKTFISLFVILLMGYFVAFFMITIPALIGTVMTKQFDLIIIWIMAIIVASIQITSSYVGSGCGPVVCEPLFAFLNSIAYTIIALIIYAIYRLGFKGKPLYPKFFKGKK